MLNLNKTETRRFPLAALLVAEPDQADAVGQVADVLARGGWRAKHAAMSAARDLTMASYHPSAWEF